jgi:hypothetical protein
MLPRYRLLPHNPHFFILVLILILATICKFSESGPVLYAHWACTGHFCQPRSHRHVLQSLRGRGRGLGLYVTVSCQCLIDVTRGKYVELFVGAKDYESDVHTHNGTDTA